MKKKTVITTEKHEVWVIRQPANAAAPPHDDQANELINSLSLADDEIAERDSGLEEED